MDIIDTFEIAGLKPTEILNPLDRAHNTGSKFQRRSWMS